MDRRVVAWVGVQVKINNKDNMIVSGVVFRQAIIRQMCRNIEGFLLLSFQCMLTKIILA